MQILNLQRFAIEAWVTYGAILPHELTPRGCRVGRHHHHTAELGPGHDHHSTSTANKVHRTFKTFQIFHPEIYIKVSNFSHRFIVKKVWKSQNIFYKYLHWKTWNSSPKNCVENLKDFVSNFSPRKFQIFHTSFRWEKFEKFKTFFTDICTEKLEMFNQCFILKTW